MREKKREGCWGAQVRVWGVNPRARSLTLALPLNTFRTTREHMAQNHRKSLKISYNVGQY